VSGALFFGWLTDRFGRKKLFMLTLVLYLVATGPTALSFTAWWFFLFRFLTGFGLGGEYAAINSAIDELIPRTHRGRVDIAINGSFWLGAAFGALLSIPALNENLFPSSVGWRLTFALGLVFGLCILLVRRNVRESPRWLFIHGQEKAGERLVEDIEQTVGEGTNSTLYEVDENITVRQRKSIGFITIAKTVLALAERPWASHCSSGRPSSTTPSRSALGPS
jgi:MFS family permease